MFGAFSPGLSIMSIKRLLAVTALSACVVLPATGASAQSLTTLYSFKGGQDGAWPLSGLTELAGALYGSTTGGADGGGSVFRITTGGDERVIYAFKASTNGSAPYAGLLKVGGMLYGTTYLGGRVSAISAGTVFKVSSAGAETLLHSFADRGDGVHPNATMIKIGAALYGTTSQGGAYGLGTVFKITPAGAETTLYSFKGGSDGAMPEAGLLNVGGVLFGTTAAGGAGCNGGEGCGTVFRLTPAGAETVIYAFRSGSDGSQPEAGLIHVNGVLYGTTNSGGQGCDLGCGTVFKVTPSGAEAVLYAFKGGADGANPDAELTNVGGLLYGVTEGGGHECPDGLGCGTLFKLTTEGAETVVHSFTGKADGMYPGAGMINLGGTLYGTTYGGGEKDSGTVFKLATSGAQ
jgi:uncharacterized repeat protein (TIGR03803 family)